VRPPSESLRDSLQDVWMPAVRRMVYGIFVNLVASPYGKRYTVNDGDFVRGIAAYHALQFRYSQAQRQKMHEDAVQDWDKFEDHHGPKGGNTKLMPTLMRAVLPQELADGRIRVESLEELRAQLQKTSENVTCWGTSFEYYVNRPRRVDAFVDGYELTSAILWILVASDTHPNELEMNHAFTGIICDDKEYVYDSNDIKVRCNWRSGDFGPYLKKMLVYSGIALFVRRNPTANYHIFVSYQQLIYTRVT
jgi:hypothetical protein